MRVVNYAEEKGKNMVDPMPNVVELRICEPKSQAMGLYGAA